MLAANRKHNKTIEKQMLKMMPEALTPEERSRIEADVDNNTPGPGLRRGSRQKEQRPRPKTPEEGTGWGGFPLNREEGGEAAGELRQLG